MEHKLIGVDLADCFSNLADWSSLWSEFDPEAYQRGLLGWEEAEAELQRERDMARRAILHPHQARWQNMLLELEGGALCCPHCKKAHADIRAYNRHPDRKSFFICQVCAFSFDPDGLPDWHKLGSGEL